MPRIVCVLGMHRSGTSLATRVLNLMGADLGPDDHLVKPVAGNPWGLWEHERLRDVNDEILSRLGGSWHEPPAFPAGWETAPGLADLRERARRAIREDFAGRELWAWKDPRTCLTLPFWQRLLPAMRYVICLRNPVDVARSLQRRDRFTIDKSGALWLGYVRSALQHTTGMARLITVYDDLVADWPTEVGRLSRFIGARAVDDEPEVRRAVHELVDRDLQHHRASLVEIAADPRLGFAAKAVYMVMRGHRGAEDEGAEQALPIFAAEAERELELTRNLVRLDALAVDLTVRLHEIERMVGWKALERLRRVRDRSVPVAGRRRTVYRGLHRVVEVLLDEGPTAVLRRGANKVRSALNGRRR